MTLILRESDPGTRASVGFGSRDAPWQWRGSSWHLFSTQIKKVWQIFIT
jgi:hypothetical protein